MWSNPAIGDPAAASSSSRAPDPPKLQLGICVHGQPARRNAGAAFRPVDVVFAQGDGGLDHYMAVALVRHDHVGEIQVFGLFRSDWAVTRRSSCRPAKLGSQRVVLGQCQVGIVQAKLPFGTNRVSSITTYTRNRCPPDLRGVLPSGLVAPPPGRGPPHTDRRPLHIA